MDTISGRHCRHAGLLIRQPHSVNKNQLTMAALLVGLNRLKLDNGGGVEGGGGVGWGEGVEESKKVRLKCCLLELRRHAAKTMSNSTFTCYITYFLIFCNSWTITWDNVVSGNNPFQDLFQYGVLFHGLLASQLPQRQKSCPFIKKTLQVVM